MTGVAASSADESAVAAVWGGLLRGATVRPSQALVRTTPELTGSLYQQLRRRLLQEVRPPAIGDGVSCAESPDGIAAVRTARIEDTVEYAPREGAIHDVMLDLVCLRSLLACMIRRHPRTGPRALRFELAPAAPPQVFVEPSLQPFGSHTTPFHGIAGATIRVWNARRLLALAPALPMLRSLRVQLTGTARSHVWIAEFETLRLTIRLRGADPRDWTRWEVEAGKPPAPAGPVLITSRVALADGRLHIAGIVERRVPEVWIDAERLVSRARCNCLEYGTTGGLATPCMHLRALHRAIAAGVPE